MEDIDQLRAYMRISRKPDTDFGWHSEKFKPGGRLRCNARYQGGWAKPTPGHASQISTHFWKGSSGNQSRNGIPSSRSNSLRTRKVQEKGEGFLYTLYIFILYGFQTGKPTSSVILIACHAQFFLKAQAIASLPVFRLGNVAR